MPIVRTYQCADCFHRLDVVLSSEQWDDPPPECPACEARAMNQEFKPIALGGSARARAIKMAETIAEEDYGVADIKVQGHHGVPKVRYKDAPAPALAGSWGAGADLMTTAMRSGRANRVANGGDGLDILQRALKSGDQPDLIEVSKRRAAKIW